MENLNQLKDLLGTFNEMLENKEFASLLKQNKQETLEKQLAFTEKEIDKMPKTFRKEFRTDGCTARVYRRQVSKNAFTYDIMYRRNGYNVIVTDKNLENAKKRFIEKLKTAEKVEKKTSGVPTTFNTFAMYHFENFRKRLYSIFTR